MSTRDLGVVMSSDVVLKPYTTFKIGGPARHFLSANSVEDVRGALTFAQRQSLPLFTLGGGSNILVSDRGFEGVVLHPDFRGIRKVREDADSATLEVNAGEPWDEVVRYAVEVGWWRIENLSHIPGQAGAALVQNIGAYGQQVSDVVESAQVVDTASGAVQQLSAADCGFAYRRSIFNSTARGRFIIVSLTLRFAKRGNPNLNYPDLRTWFAESSAKRPAEIRQAIIAIRDRKFPFPREERGGNAGSFFKNLSLTEAEFATLRANLNRHFSPQEVSRLDEMRKRFPTRDTVKVPTAFLIEICGLKGHRMGGAQVNEPQPLVLLNQGGATAQDVLALARHVRRTVYARTGMKIPIEPELVGFTKEEIADLHFLPDV